MSRQNDRICRESGAQRMSHNVAVANSEAPAPSEMDTALLVSRVVSDFTVWFWDNGVCLLLPRCRYVLVINPS